MTHPPRGAAAAVAIVLVVLPAALALGSDHLAGAPLLLVGSTTAAALAVGALAVQPWLAARRRAHVLVGGAVLGLVVLHVVGLFLLSPDDALFAMSPDGPTRARMALMSLVLLVVVVVLGALRRRLGWNRPTWRLLHGGLAALAVVLGVGHAVLTDGALEGVGTVVLLGLGVLALLGGVLARRRTAPRRPDQHPDRG